MFSAQGQRTGSSGESYAGFGAQVSGWYDQETGLTLFGLRYYDPSTGRFVNRDPIGYAGGSNLYGYVGNNPVKGMDPLGLDAGRLVSGIAGSAIGFVMAGPAGAIGGYFAGTGVYDGIVHLGPTVGCYESGQASGWDVAGAGFGLAFNLGAAIVPGGEEFQAAEGGLGLLEGRTVQLSENGISIIENHLSDPFFSSGQKINGMMIDRLREALSEGRAECHYCLSRVFQ